MTPEVALWIIITAASCFLAGWITGNNMKPPLPQQIQTYLREHYPNEWRAYQNGVREGYQQGLRDCQEPHDEPA